MIREFYRAQLGRPYVKPLMAWSDIAVLEPFSAVVTEWLAPYRWLTPNAVTCVSFLVNCFAVYFYALGGWSNWVVGAVIWQAGYILDGVDGKLARKLGLKSPFGAKLDVTLDKVKKLMCLAAIWWASPAADQAVLGGLYLAQYVIQSLRVPRNPGVDAVIHPRRVREVFDPLDGQCFLVLLGPLTASPVLFAGLTIAGQLADRAAHLFARRPAVSP